MNSGTLMAFVQVPPTEFVWEQKPSLDGQSLTANPTKEAICKRANPTTEGYKYNEKESEAIWLSSLTLLEDMTDSGGPWHFLT